MEKIRRIKTLINDMGVNLAGVEVILRLMNQLSELEQIMTRTQEQLDRLRQIRKHEG